MAKTEASLMMSYRKTTWASIQKFTWKSSTFSIGPLKLNKIQQNKSLSTVHGENGHFFFFFSKNLTLFIKYLIQDHHSFAKTHTVFGDSFPIQPWDPFQYILFLLKLFWPPKKPPNIKWVWETESVKQRYGGMCCSFLQSLARPRHFLHFAKGKRSKKCQALSVHYA